jgi:predicted transposase YbfD/YdcC
MDAQPTALLTRMFDDIDESVDDPRADNARHFLCDVLIVAFLGVMGGCDDYPGIVEFARDRAAWLSSFLRLPHGVPSVSTFRRVFAAVKPSVLTGLLQRWSGELAGTLAGKQIVLDGKTLRRSFDHAWDKDSALHVVTAWCVEERLVLAQQAVDQKSNEITAVPEVLKMLDIKDAVVTVDALNTQTDIAGQIVRGGGDYVMAVKDNHPTLADSVRRHLDEMILEKFAGVEHVYHETTDAGHGRIDTRKVWATGDIDWLGRRGEWKKLSSVIVVESVRRENAKAEPTLSRRYYISSLKADSGRRLAELIRNHWSIENSQHWTLDMSFNEDHSRVRKDHGDQNLAVMRRLALGLLRRDKQVKVGAKNKRLKAGRNPDYLLSVLLGTPMVK